MRLLVSPLLFALVTVLVTPIPAEAQLTDVDCVALVDSVGTRVARAYPNRDLTSVFFFEHNGETVQLTLQTQKIQGLRQVVFFTDAACTSTPYVDPFPGVTTSVVVDQDVYYVDPFAVEQPVVSLSRRDSLLGPCQTITLSADLAPAIHFTLPQFTPPFILESEACSTPAPGQVINGCITKNGTLKIVADPADCNARETPISWLGIN